MESCCPPQSITKISRSESIALGLRCESFLCLECKKEAWSLPIRQSNTRKQDFVDLR